MCFLIIDHYLIYSNSFFVQESRDVVGGKSGQMPRHVNILSKEIDRISSMRCDKTREVFMHFQ